MVSLFQSLVDRGLSGHSAWRAAYAIVPVPILFFVAAITLIFGTDCPAGKWSDRHKLPASTFAIRHGHAAAIAHDVSLCISCSFSNMRVCANSHISILRLTKEMTKSKETLQSQQSIPRTRPISLPTSMSPSTSL